MLRIAICDDNQEFANHEASIITRHDSDACVDLYPSGEDLLNIGEKIREYDLILLDYEMKGLTGFETAEIIRKRYASTVNVAFVTVFYDFSRAGYKYDALRYLVKQENTFEAELIDLIDIVSSRKCEQPQEVTIKFVDGVATVDIRRIIYAETEGHYILVTVDSNSSAITRKIRGKIKDFTWLSSFTPIRKGTVVNMQYVTEINKMNMLELGCNNKKVAGLLIAQSYRKSVMLQYLKSGEQF